MNALNGTESKETKLTQSYMDYAFPLHNGDAVKYVIYIKDTCQMQNSVTHSMVTILLILLLVSLIISSIAGSIISKSITDPIKQLSVQAKKLAAGDINALQKSDSKDEIADLTNSLINLAHTRKQSSDQAKGEKIKVETILQNMNDGIIAFDLKGNLIHFNREAKKLLNRQYLDDIRFDRFFKEINANITLGDLLYMNPDGSVEREIKLANQYLRLNFAPFKADNKVGGTLSLYTMLQSRKNLSSHVVTLLRTCRMNFVHRLQQSSLTPKHLPICPTLTENCKYVFLTLSRPNLTEWQGL